MRRKACAVIVWDVYSGHESTGPCNNDILQENSLEVFKFYYIIQQVVLFLDLTSWAAHVNHTRPFTQPARRGLVPEGDVHGPGSSPSPPWTWGLPGTQRVSLHTTPQELVSNITDSCQQIKCSKERPVEISVTSERHDLGSDPASATYCLYACHGILGVTVIRDVW